MRAILSAIFAATCALSAAQLPTYRVTVLPELSEFTGMVQICGINTNGDIAGTCYTTGNSSSTTWLWKNGTLSNLGIPSSSVAAAINDSDWIVGSYDYLPYGSLFTWHDGTLRDFQDGESGVEMWCAAINSQNLVVYDGILTGLGDAGGCSIYNPTTNQFSEITGLGGAYTTGFGINSLGYVVGSSDPRGQTLAHAFIATNGIAVDLSPGITGYAAATAINDNNLIVGQESFANAQMHAVYFENYTIVDLGTPPGYAQCYPSSINSSGTFVGGASQNDGYENQGPVFIHINGAMHMLSQLTDSSLGSQSLMAPAAINDKGYIAASVSGTSGTFAAVLTPYFFDAPTSYAIDTGIYLSGNVGSLATIDGSYLVVKEGLTVSNTQPPVSIEVDGTASNTTIGDLRLNLTAKANSVGLQQKVEFWDFQAGQWVTIGTQSATTQLSTQLAIGSNPSRFVQSGTNAVRARLSWIQIGPISTYPWSVSIDQAVWNDSP